MLKKIHPSFTAILFLLVLLANLYVVFAPANSLLNWFTTDDAFYYFKTAQNFTEGRGISFDGIARSSGFHPLWMLVCMGVFWLARFDLILPLRIIVLISILLAAGSSVLLYRLLKKAISPEAAGLAAVVWAFLPQIHSQTTQLGMESSINVFFILLLLFRLSIYEERNQQLGNALRPLLGLGLVAVFTLFSRLDNLFLLFMVGLWLVFRSRPMRRLLVIDFVLSAATVFCSFYLRVGFWDGFRPYMQSAYFMIMLALVIKSIAFYFFGLYGHSGGHGFWRDAIRIAGAVVASSALLGAGMLALGAAGAFVGYPRTVLLVDAGLTLVWVFGLRLLHNRLESAPGLLPPADAFTPMRNNFGEWLKRGLAYSMLPATSLLAYMGWSKWYFGVFSPVSGQIKHWWGTLYTVYGLPVRSFAEFFGFPPDLTDGPWALAFDLPSLAAEWLVKMMALRGENTAYHLAIGISVALVAAGMVVIFVKWRAFVSAGARLALLPLLAAVYAQVIYYNGSNYVNMRGWYWMAADVFLILVIGFVLDGILGWLRGLKVGRMTLRLGTGAVGVLLVGIFMAYLLALIPPTVVRENLTAYVDGIRVLEENTEPGSLIGSTGGGVIAYFIQGRTVVNLDGLMNSLEYFEMLKARHPDVYLDSIGLDYVYGNSYMLTGSEPYMWAFAGRLEEVGYISLSTLYRYLPGQ